MESKSQAIDQTDEGGPPEKRLRTELPPLTKGTLPQAPVQGDDGGRPENQLRLNTHAATETECTSSQLPAITGQLRAKIKDLVKSRQVPNVNNPKGSSELLRKTFADDIWPAVEADYKMMMEKLKQQLENGLLHEGIHAGVFARVKLVESIEQSLKRREDHLFVEKWKRFESLDEILRSIHDLIGLRIVVPFRDQAKWFWEQDPFPAPAKARIAYKAISEHHPTNNPITLTPFHLPSPPG
ncbi:hypothetical protein C8A01DRAFT_21475 [Parachaetomium inaequale]|uniref:Uncharacterized protein n=1 Tax=Parachaetomium inaequale TaxID=2588326 RepID=A0AAN6P478_9PEZI|nr:hypothetical protein C8A01DRAFT_21475 [Parachaetomium inaequale]